MTTDEPDQTGEYVTGGRGVVPVGQEGTCSQCGSTNPAVRGAACRAILASRWHSRPDDPDDLLYEAWCVIANAHEGNWNEASDEWRGAAERWRDRWHATLQAAPSGRKTQS